MAKRSYDEIMAEAKWHEAMVDVPKFDKNFQRGYILGLKNSVNQSRKSVYSEKIINERITKLAIAITEEKKSGRRLYYQAVIRGHAFALGLI